jgi:hypothetical protein
MQSVNDLLDAHSRRWMVGFDQPPRGLIQANEDSLIMMIQDMEASLGITSESPQPRQRTRSSASCTTP